MNARPSPEALGWLAGLPGWAGGRVLRRLPGGASADSWLLSAHGGLAVLRQDRPLAARLGLDRASEWQALTAAHAAGLGPEPLHRDPRRGLLLRRWLAGEAWRPADLARPGGLEALGRVLRRLHRLPAAGAVFDPRAVAERYARGAGRRGLAPRVALVARLSEGLYSGAGRRLCHHDPHAGNLVGRRPLRLLDWEYAAAGEPLFDLAVACQYHRLGAARRERLLAAWTTRPDAALRERLDAFRALYDALSGLWELAVARG